MGRIDGKSGTWASRADQGVRPRAPSRAPPRADYHLFVGVRADVFILAAVCLDRRLGTNRRLGLDNALRSDGPDSHRIRNSSLHTSTETFDNATGVTHAFAAGVTPQGPAGVLRQAQPAAVP